MSADDDFIKPPLEQAHYPYRTIRVTAEKILGKPRRFRAVSIPPNLRCAECGFALYVTENKDRIFTVECVGNPDCSQATVVGRLPVIELDPL